MAEWHYWHAAVYAENEGHGFSKKANRDYLYATMALFLEQQFK